jgi:hypothetical protein
MGWGCSALMPSMCKALGYFLLGRAAKGLDAGLREICGHFEIDPSQRLYSLFYLFDKRLQQ